jgi:hypothetical protein
VVRRRFGCSSQGHEQQRETDLCANLHCFSEKSIPEISGTKNSAINATVNAGNSVAAFQAQLNFFVRILQEGLPSARACVSSGGENCPFDEISGLQVRS